MYSITFKPKKSIIIIALILFLAFTIHYYTLYNEVQKLKNENAWLKISNPAWEQDMEEAMQEEFKKTDELMKEIDAEIRKADNIRDGIYDAEN